MNLEKLIGGGKFSNVEVEKDTGNLEKIISQLEKRKTGLEKNILKVKARQFLIENQVEIEEVATSK